MLTRLTKVRNSGVDDKKKPFDDDKNALITITKIVPMMMTKVRVTKKCPDEGFKSHIFA